MDMRNITRREALELINRPEPHFWDVKSATKRVLAALAVAALPVASVATAASSATTAPAPTSTSLSATPNASNAGGYVTFKGETNYILNGRWADLPNSTVTILYLVRGTTTWHTFAQFKTNSTGNYSQRYRYNFKTTVHFHARV